MINADYHLNREVMQCLMRFVDHGARGRCRFGEMPELSLLLLVVGMLPAVSLAIGEILILLGYVGPAIVQS